MNILGINFGHDGSVAIVKNNRLISAISRERITRRKKDRGICEATLNYILSAANITLDEINAIAFSSYFYNPTQSLVKIFTKSGELIEQDLIHLLGGTTATEFQMEIAGVLKPAFLIQHHMAHLSAAYYTSPFNSAAGLSVDASGVHPEYCSLFGLGMGNMLDYLYCPGIMAGNVYSVFTERLGIGPGLTKAGTLMALAALGERQAYSDNWENDFASWYERDFQASDALYTRYLWTKWTGLHPNQGLPPSIMPSEEVRNHAASLQYAFERVMVKNATKIYQETISLNDGNLVLAGGSFLNSDANMKIYQEAGFENIHLFPACGDDGTAVGAALYLLHAIAGAPREFYLPNEFMYLGKDHLGEITDTLDYKYIAESLDQEKIVCWYQGQSEFGPRALGNRSFLASPKSLAIKERINSEIKHREWYRPFAPAVLSENKEEWFDLNFESKIMLFITNVKKPELVPGICHVDNSARVQTVEESDNPRFYNLIKAFEEVSGIPILLNTSLNDNGEPLVDSPEDAHSLFQRVNADLLVIGNEIISK